MKYIYITEEEWINEAYKYRMYNKRIQYIGEMPSIEIAKMYNQLLQNKVEDSKTCGHLLKST